jgi:hypothetical protein
MLVSYDPYQQDPPDPHRPPPEQPQQHGYDPYAQPYESQPTSGYGQSPHYSPQQPFTAPPYNNPYGGQPPQRPQNGFGVAAMVLGICSAVLMWCCSVFATMPLGTLAIVFGGIGLGKANRGEATNKSMALTGLICGSISLALSLCLQVLRFALGWNDWNHYDNYY